jgi:hypothetical protein
MIEEAVLTAIDAFIVCLGSRTISNSSLLLPRPPEDLPRGFYDGFSKESKDVAPCVPDLNIGNPVFRTLILVTLFSRP